MYSLLPQLPCLIEWIHDTSIDILNLECIITSSVHTILNVQVLTTDLPTADLPAAVTFFRQAGLMQYGNALYYPRYQPEEGLGFTSLTVADVEPRSNALALANDAEQRPGGLHILFTRVTREAPSMILYDVETGEPVEGVEPIPFGLWCSYKRSLPATFAVTRAQRIRRRCVLIRKKCERAASIFLLSSFPLDVIELILQHVSPDFNLVRFMAATSR